MHTIVEKYGFQITHKQQLPELKAQLWELTHAVTGAKLLWMDNKQDNKLFCVSFQTLPEDSTGVFHILEHSVLCGSEKYPVREPFVELLKSSMNTFLNAMTFPDKTMYPVSSRNSQDFLNLTAVYLDAVFAPRILTDPNIFYQEGWHAEAGEAPCFKGVVYNEMKGAMAGVDDRIEQGMLQLLFPDSCYRHNSGGAPEHIPELTYSQFVDTYRRFYHPGNASFYLDGDVPLEQALALISGYLRADAPAPVLPELKLQAPVSNRDTGYYEVAQEEPRKAIVTFGKILCTWSDRVTQLAAQVLCDVLAGSNDAPLKRALLATGLVEDVRCSLTDSIAQPCFMLQLRNMELSSAQALEQVIRDTALSLKVQGLRPEALEASINVLAYSLRQKHEPQGLLRAMDVLRSTLYGGEAALYLEHDAAIESLRQMVRTGGFDALLEKLLLDKTGLCRLDMLPSATLGQEEQTAEAEKLRALLEKTDLEALARQNESLLSWQQTEDTPQQLATLPVLPLSQVGQMPPQPPTQVLEEQGVQVLHHPIATDGIEYLALYFSLADMPQELLSRLAVAGSLLGKLPTANRSALELQEQVKRSIGSLHFDLEVLPQGKDLGACQPTLCVYAGYLKENREKAQALILEMLLSTDLTQADAIREILLQDAEDAKQGAIMAGHSLASRIVQSHYSAMGAATEAIAGLTGLKALRLLAEKFEEEGPGLIAQLQQLQQCFCRSRLTLSLTAPEYPGLEGLILGLPQGAAMGQPAVYTPVLPRRLGIRIPAQTAFAVQCHHLSRCASSYHGSLAVMDTILSLSYLWNQIRVQGGAYGAGMQADRRGTVLYYSYRDPSPKRSLEVYAAAGDFLRDFREEPDKYILSAVAGMDPLRTPAERGHLADVRWFAGLDTQTLETIRSQMIDTTAEALRGWAEVLDQVARDGAVCVVAHEAALKEFSDLQILEL